MRCFGMARQKCPVADVLDLKSPSVMIAAKCPRASGMALAILLRGRN
jgi:hypothetical protein